jgi:CRISPR-associated protein Cmr4
VTDFRIGYLYSFAPVHCGGEGDLGNILEIAREAHTNFPYIPGSSWRGSLRNEVTAIDPDAANTLFGQELNGDEPMGVHQVWFGDARLLWVPMRTLSMGNGTNVFAWVSCHSLIRDHALLARGPATTFPERALGTTAGRYIVADAELDLGRFSEEQTDAIALSGTWPSSLNAAVRPIWETNRIVLPDADFDVLMEHSLWTQVRNKIQEQKENSNNNGSQAGSAEIFWTDVCIPRDTLFYYPWGYAPLKEKDKSISKEHQLLMEVLGDLIQVGGQANVGRGWVQSWVADDRDPSPSSASKGMETTSFGEDTEPKTSKESAETTVGT